MTQLAEKAAELAETFSDLLNGTVTTGAKFGVTDLPERGLAWVLPAGSAGPTKPELVPIHLDETQAARLWLKVTCTVRLDYQHEHLAVVSSSFGLCVNRETHRSVIRIDYDRERGVEPGEDAAGSNRQAAHVHIHGTSAELAYALSAAGQPLRDLHDFHVPVGGRRFRPSLEDFVEFLHAEGLVAMKDGWKDCLASHRQGWMERQLAAAVRRDPETAARQLDKMGYEVTPPAP